jgi:hypothetical protein
MPFRSWDHQERRMKIRLAHSHTDRFILALLAVALLALVGCVLVATNYVQGMRSVRDLGFSIEGIEVANVQEATVALHVTNGSSLDLRLEELNLVLYLNGQYVGSYYEPFKPLRLARAEERSLPLVIGLQPVARPVIDAAQKRAEFAWLARGSVRVILPFREKTLLVSVREPWRER